jgi:hypothetical protein
MLLLLPNLDNLDNLDYLDYLIQNVSDDGLYIPRDRDPKSSIVFCISFSGLIECYDLQSGLWSVEKRYPQEVWEHACVSLYIPRCRDDMDIAPIAAT